jgi:photosystem II stability/assembly factor-like uncharacterized protein
MRCAAWLACLAAIVQGAEVWELRYLYDADNSQLSLADFVFASARRGMACGVLREDGRERPVLLMTGDGGSTWELRPVPDACLALFFVNETTGWLVGRKGLYRSEEAGMAWRRIPAPSGLLRVWFADERRGWAVGTHKAVYATTDGGSNWQRVPAADEVKTTPEYTAYVWIVFADAQRGMIVGNSRPPRRDEAKQLPEWLDPERAQRRRERPSLGIVLETRDGGSSWSSSVTSMFGQITRVRLAADGRGLALIEFTRPFDWPSEVFSLNWKGGRSERVFRRADRAVTDLALARDGWAYLAAVEPVGQKIRLPVPGKIHVLRSQDLSRWEEAEVDYRAFGRRAMLSEAPDGRLWLVTDAGAVLERVVR